jgi:hypothetical protein
MNHPALTAKTTRKQQDAEIDTPAWFNPIVGSRVCLSVRRPHIRVFAVSYLHLTAAWKGEGGLFW